MKIFLPSITHPTLPQQCKFKKEIGAVPAPCGINPPSTAPNRQLNIYAMDHQPANAAQRVLLEARHRQTLHAKTFAHEMRYGCCKFSACNV